VPVIFSQGPIWQEDLNHTGLAACQLLRTRVKCAQLPEHGLLCLAQRCPTCVSRKAGLVVNAKPVFFIYWALPHRCGHLHRAADHARNRQTHLKALGLFEGLEGLLEGVVHKKLCLKRQVWYSVQRLPPDSKPRARVDVDQLRMKERWRAGHRLRWRLCSKALHLLEQGASFPRKLSVIEECQLLHRLRQLVLTDPPASGACNKPTISVSNCLKILSDMVATLTVGRRLVAVKQMELYARVAVDS
jgi:hypothetical protein